MEKFTFWSHLQASDILSLGSKNVEDLNFGEGQPEAPINSGYRLSEYSFGGWFCGTQYRNGIIFVTQESSADMSGNMNVPCTMIRSIDSKIDNGEAYGGKVVGWGCTFTNAACGEAWNNAASGNLWFDAAF